MNEAFDNLLLWISQHPEQAGWVIGFIACVESLALVGVVIPGAVILIGAGALIGAGVLDFWSSCAWAIAGAIVGDGVSYLLGRRLDYLTTRWRWLRINPDYVQKGVDFFQRYGDISVALGRFLGPTRAVVPMAAGILKMPVRRFYIANVLSAIIWAPAYLAPGILLGHSVNQSDWSHILLSVLGLTTLILIWLGIRSFSKKKT
ncbi:MAG: DedA family protein [Pseudomonadota bacterium]